MSQKLNVTVSRASARLEATYELQATENVAAVFAVPLTRKADGTATASAACDGQALTPIAHVADMYRHLSAVKGGEGFDLEVSVDETDATTSTAEHLFVALELQRLGVRWASLAPRFVGRFEKGVDYIGDLAAFEADIRAHAAIAREHGGYKISLHSDGQAA